MNIIQYVYQDKAAQDVSRVTGESFNGLMLSIMHETPYVNNKRFAPLKFVVVNGEPYAEWVDHSETEWKNLVNELAKNKLAGMLGEILEQVMGDDDGEQRP